MNRSGRGQQADSDAQCRSVVSEDEVVCASRHVEEYMVEPIRVGISPVLSCDAD